MSWEMQKEFEKLSHASIEAPQIFYATPQTVVLARSAKTHPFNTKTWMLGCKQKERPLIRNIERLKKLCSSRVPFQENEISRYLDGPSFLYFGSQSFCSNSTLRSLSSRNKFTFKNT